jgi:hypothetical protein
MGEIVIMIDNIVGKCKGIFIKAVKNLSGYNRRIVLAELSEEIGRGGQSLIAREFNVGRDTIRKGVCELKCGIRCKDAYNMRGRKSSTEHLPNLADDIRAIAESQCQTDPTFKSTRLYTRLTINEFRKQLIEAKNYTLEELPSHQTLNTLVNKLGYNMKKVQKTKPLKKIPETDAIFENLKKLHEEIKDDETVVRLSIDAKDRVKVGNFSRGGKSRVATKAKDHDFCDEHVTPFGIMDVKEGTVDISIAESRITADYIADELEEYWNRHNLQDSKKVILLNSDNGPENGSSRTQFIKRMVCFSLKHNIKIILAYYPPYHSKYNPIERVWGILEKHWNGDLLDSKDTIFKFIKSMTYKGKNPNVAFVEKIYEKGVTLTKKEMSFYEPFLDRTEGIEKWGISISPENYYNNAINMELIS